MHLLQPLLQLFKSRPRRQDISACRRPVARPTRDWSVTLWSTVALAAILIGAAGVLYILSPWSSAAFRSQLQSGGLTIEKLQASLSHYESLRAEHESLFKAPPAVVDPAK